MKRVLLFGQLLLLALSQTAPVQAQSIPVCHFEPDGSLVCTLGGGGGGGSWPSWAATPNESPQKKAAATSGSPNSERLCLTFTTSLSLTRSATRMPPVGSWTPGRKRVVGRSSVSRQ